MKKRDFTLFCSETLPDSPDKPSSDSPSRKRSRLTEESSAESSRPSVTVDVVRIWLVRDWSSEPLSSDVLSIYQTVAYKLIDVLKNRREECDDAKKEYLFTLLQDSCSQKERIECKKLLALCQAEIDSLADGMIDLYVGQTMDWILATRNVVSHRFGQKTLLQQTLSIGLAALSIVLKTHHYDVGIVLGPSLQQMVGMTECDKTTLRMIEMALLRSVDYNVFKFVDGYSLLSRKFDSLIGVESREAFEQIADTPEFLGTFGTYMRAMIVDRIETFAVYTPWVRANAALAMTIGQRPDEQTVRRRSPSRKDACAMLEIIKQIDQEQIDQEQKKQQDNAIGATDLLKQPFGAIKR